MERIKSKINTSSEEFKNNHKHNIALINDLRDRLAEVIDRSNDKSVIQHKKRGKLLARDRIELLIDQNTPFLELSTLAAINQYENQFPSAGIVTGIGIIEGKEAIIVANDATVKGGTYVKETIKKHIRAQEIAMQNRLPCVYLVDSGGVFLPEQANVFPDRFDFGRFFYNQARMSARGIPQIAIVLGSCTAGGAYVPAMSDEVIIVKEQGTIFIGGPPLVKAATGEEVSPEELGGAWVHTHESGVADHLAEDDVHALNICRDIFKTLNKEPLQKIEERESEEPYYLPSELYGIISSDTKRPIDAREIIARIVDGSYFHEFKSNYATSLVCGFSRIMGYPVGILANSGVFFSETSLKGAHFIELCCARNIPIVFLQNITGFMVGKKYERGGLAKDGAKLVHAVANANVPKFTIIFGGSFGAGNYAMAGRAYEPNLLFMWPNAKISVMGGEQAASVLTTIKEDQLNKNGKKLSQKEKRSLQTEILKKYEEEGSAYYSTSRLWDDGIIDPVDTRTIIGMGISMSLNKKWDKPDFGIFRM